MRNNMQPNRFNPNVGSGAEPHQQSHNEAQQISNRLDPKPHTPVKGGFGSINTGWAGQNHGNYGRGGSGNGSVLP